MAVIHGGWSGQLRPATVTDRNVALSRQNPGPRK